MLKTLTRDVRVRGTERLISPGELIAELPMTSEVEESVLEGRRQVERILDGEDDRLMAIVGPCSIHDTRASLECQGRCENVPAGRSKTVPLNAVEWASRFVGRWRSGSVR